MRSERSSLYLEDHQYPSKYSQVTLQQPYVVLAPPHLAQCLCQPLGVALLSLGLGLGFGRALLAVGRDDPGPQQPHQHRNQHQLGRDVGRNAA
jgi:hypothetical protein